MAGSDAMVWAGMALLFLLYSQTKLARSAGLLKGLGEWLRTLAKAYGFYADRRSFQIAASLAVALIAAILLLYGVIWMRDQIKRYRLAVGLASLAFGFAIIRFISLHEVDAWNAEMPWARVGFDLIGAAGTSVVAPARLRQLGEFRRFRPSGRH